MLRVASFQVLNIAYSARWWSFTSSVRGVVESFCAHSTADPDFSERVGMTTHELLENAVKYSNDPDELVRCEVDVQDGRLYVRVQNQAAPTHIETLRREYEAVTSGDPLEIYLEKMDQDVHGQHSQLGLARILYEGEAELGMAIDADLVKMEAQFPMPERVSA